MLRTSAPLIGALDLSMRAIPILLAISFLHISCCDAREKSTDCHDQKEPQVVSYPSPQKDWTVYVRHDDTDDSWSYSVFAKDRAGKVIDISKAETKGEITVRWLSAELAQISWPLGMGFASTIFMNSHGVLSRMLTNLLAVDVTRNLVAEASCIENETVDISPIYRTLKDPVQIVRLKNAARTASGNPVVSAKFLSNGKLLITYLIGLDGVTADIQVDVLR